MLISPPVSLLGAEQPRVECRPPAAFSLGVEAAELSARAGLVLEPWQVAGLELMLSVRPDGKWACFEYAEICARQNGKTALFMARALAGLFLLGERLIMWSAHEYKTAMESFLQVRALIASLVEQGLVAPVKVSSTNGEEGFLLPSGARLKFLARSKGSGRGFSGDVNIIDEAFAYTRTQQSALMPTMNARPNPQICYASSPPLDSDSGEVLFSLRRRAEAGGDGSLGYRDWGLSGDLDELARMGDREREELLDDRGRWVASNPALGRGRVDEESIERNRRSMGEPDFAREILGIWPVPADAGGRVIRAAAWDRLADPASTIEGTPVLAIDATPEHSMAAIVKGGYAAAGLVHVEVVEQRRGLDWVAARVVELNEALEPAAVLIDPRGPAGALVTDLEAAGLPLVEITTGDLVQACGAFFAAVHADEQVLVHLGEADLDAAVESGRRRDVGDGGWAWGRRNSEANIAPLVAATLAHHGAVVYAGDPLNDIW